MTRHDPPEAFERSTAIGAPPERIWEHLTIPELMKTWMSSPEMGLEIETDWAVGSPIVMRGFNHAYFRNTGIVLEFEPATRLAYTHLSSLSQLPDEPRSYSALEFRLGPEDDVTVLDLRASGFPTVSIFKHLRLYWSGAILELKRRAEQAEEGRKGRS